MPCFLVCSTLGFQVLWSHLESPVSGPFPGQGGWAGWHSRHYVTLQAGDCDENHCLAVWTFSRLGGNFQILFLLSPTNVSLHLGAKNRIHPEGISVHLLHSQPRLTPNQCKPQNSLGRDVHAAGRPSLSNSQSPWERSMGVWGIGMEV